MCVFLLCSDWQPVSSEQGRNQRGGGQQTLGSVAQVDWVSVSTHTSPSLHRLQQKNTHLNKSFNLSWGSFSSKNWTNLLLSFYSTIVSTYVFISYKSITPKLHNIYILYIAMSANRLHRGFVCLFVLLSQDAPAYRKNSYRNWYLHGCDDYWGSLQGRIHKDYANSFLLISREWGFWGGSHFSWDKKPRAATVNKQRWDILKDTHRSFRQSF